eukprot:6601389-Pyramimonas_sp.AAC.1
MHSSTWVWLPGGSYRARGCCKGASQSCTVCELVLLWMASSSAVGMSTYNTIVGRECTLPPLVR